MEKEQLEEELLNLLAEICEDDIVMTETDVDLFESGLLDSIAYMELLLEIESQLGVTIAPSEVTRDDVNTPEKLVALVWSKL